jgi:hypothetical protein
MNQVLTQDRGLSVCKDKVKRDVKARCHDGIYEGIYHDIYHGTKLVRRILSKNPPDFVSPLLTQEIRRILIVRRIL